MEWLLEQIGSTCCWVAAVLNNYKVLLDDDDDDDVLWWWLWNVADTEGILFCKRAWRAGLLRLYRLALHKVRMMHVVFVADVFLFPRQSMPYGIAVVALVLAQTLVVVVFSHCYYYCGCCS